MFIKSSHVKIVKKLEAELTVCYPVRPAHRFVLWPTVWCSADDWCNGCRGSCCGCCSGGDSGYLTLALRLQCETIRLAL